MIIIDINMNNPKILFRKDRHLSSALLTGEIDYVFAYKDKPEGLKQEHRAILEYIDQHEGRRIKSEFFLGWCMDNFKKLGLGVSDFKELNKSFECASEALRLSTKDFIGCEVIKNIAVTNEIKDFYCVKQNIDECFKQITYSDKMFDEYKIGNLKGHCFGNLHIVWVNKKDYFVLTHNHLTALRDIFNSWFSVSVYSLLNRNKYSGYDLYKETLDVFDAGTQIVNMYSRKAYDLIKIWSSMVIGNILKQKEDNPSFLNSLLEDFEIYSHTNLYRILVRKLPDDISVHLNLELAGLAKCFGHPEIDMDSSVDSWIQKGTLMKPEVSCMSNILLWSFRLEFARQYYLKNNKWPNCKLGLNVPYYIKDSYEGNKWSENPSRPWVYEDFIDVEFDHTLSFDYHIDTTDLISDKSIIPSFEQWPHEFDRQAHRTMYGFFPKAPRPTPKSVVLDYLSKEKVDVRDILDVISKEEVPISWLVTVAVAKEREFKWEKARFYCKMSPEIRLYQVVTEENI